MNGKVESNDQKQTLITDQRDGGRYVPSPHAPPPHTDTQPTPPTHTHTDTYTHTYIYTYIHTYIHTHTHTHTQAHTHTHML